MKWLPLVFLISCAQVTSLNLRQHQFGIVPTKIIWFQIAGLEEEQLAMLRFSQPAERKTSFEENICLGKTWSYNLYELRNSAQATFLSQLTGKKNIQQTCADSELRPIWNYLVSHGYNTGILEVGPTKDQSLASFGECKESGEAFMNSLHLWIRQTAVKGAETYHLSEEIPVRPGNAMYDRTCNGRTCSHTITESIKAIYQRVRRISHKHLMVVRDFSYLEALEKKDFIRARSILAEYEAAYAEALNLIKDPDYLILLTTGDSRFVDMPDKGKAWFEFDKLGAANAVVKRSKLTNLVLASGSRAENFCGIYEDAQVFDRILSGPKQQGLELKIINPFK